MKININKIICIIMSITLSFTMLTACSQSSQKKSDNDMDYFKPAPKEQVILTYYYLGNADNDMILQKIFSEIEKKSADELNVKLNFKYIWVKNTGLK